MKIDNLTSFAAGTTDGPGAFDFTQAMTRGKITWDLIRDDVIVPVVCKEKPPQSYYDCHHPKPVLLPTGCLFKLYYVFLLTYLIIHK